MNQTNHRFDCPLCGAPYQLSGVYSGTRTGRYGLSRFNLEIKTLNETRRTDNKPLALSIADAISIVVDVRHLIRGKLHI